MQAARWVSAALTQLGGQHRGGLLTTGHLTTGLKVDT